MLALFSETIRLLLTLFELGGDSQELVTTQDGEVEIPGPETEVGGVIIHDG